MCTWRLRSVLLLCVIGKAMAGVWDVTVSPGSGSVSVYADASASQSIMNLTVWQNVSHALQCSIVNCTPIAAKSYYTFSPSVIASTTTLGYCELSVSSSLPYASAGGGGSNLLQLELVDLATNQIVSSLSYSVLVKSAASSTSAPVLFVPSSTATSWIYTPSGTAVTIVTTLLTAALVTSITVVICRSCTANPLLEAGENVIVEHVHVPPAKQELSYSYSAPISRPQTQSQTRNVAPMLEKRSWEAQTGKNSVHATEAESEFRKPPQTAVVI